MALPKVIMVKIRIVTIVIVTIAIIFIVMIMIVIVIIQKIIVMTTSQNLEAVTLPSGLQSLTFGRDFNQSLEDPHRTPTEPV